MAPVAWLSVALPLDVASLDCHAISADVTNAYCNKMCNWTPPYCPSTKCQCASPPPSPSPLPSPPSPAPTPSPLPPINYPDLRHGVGTTGTWYPGSAGKCGGYQQLGADTMVAFPLAYWPKMDKGNCEDCGIACGSGTVTLDGKPLCYRLTNAAGKSETAQVVESCGGNCVLPGKTDCLISPDCASNDLPYDPSHRCAPAQACGGLALNVSAPISLDATGHRPIPCHMLPFADSPDPGFVDWCNGQWVHFDTANARSSLCDASAMGGSGVCPITYEQIDCGSLSSGVAI